MSKSMQYYILNRAVRRVHSKRG